MVNAPLAKLLLHGAIAILAGMAVAAFAIAVVASEYGWRG